jgi:hypothetical protein
VTPRYSKKRRMIFPYWDFHDVLNVSDKVLLEPTTGHCTHNLVHYVDVYTVIRFNERLVRERSVYDKHEKYKPTSTRRTCPLTGSSTNSNGISVRPEGMVSRVNTNSTCCHDNTGVNAVDGIKPTWAEHNSQHLASPARHRTLWTMQKTHQTILKLLQRRAGGLDPSQQTKCRCGSAGTKWK